MEGVPRCRDPSKGLYTSARCLPGREVTVAIRWSGESPPTVPVVPPPHANTEETGAVLEASAASEKRRRRFVTQHLAGEALRCPRGYTATATTTTISAATTSNDNKKNITIPPKPQVSSMQPQHSLLSSLPRIQTAQQIVSILPAINSAILRSNS
ncbi:hypothetical protein E2C01_089854 [Portunus trituberculatus]|uniref:Uncharacterized protein n=1 Tax=Portunus trituberculatus TaxID=210409 RepID=A0A5B7JJD4_PORTR|nr:hypothetical protein [Portunus trituberculatus]